MASPKRCFQKLRKEVQQSRRCEFKATKDLACGVLAIRILAFSALLYPFGFCTKLP